MPSEFTGSFSRVYAVVEDQVLHSGQANLVAKRLNQTILSGLGDAHWRSLWGAHSLVRNFRLGDGGVPQLFPPEDEWWQLYGLYQETDWDWPSASAGDYEGLNKDCPIVGYFFGPQNGTSFDDEQTRAEEVPLREYLGAPAPSTPLEVWDLGKDQRGGITSADLTNFSAAPAMRVARLMDDVNATIGEHDPKHKTCGGKIKDSSDEYIREKGQQWNQMRTYFASEWRGTDAEREAAGDWDPKVLTAAYEEMLASQWFLAPAYGTAVGSLGAVSVTYPLFEWASLATAGTYGTIDVSFTGHVSSTGFSFAGFIAVGSSLTSDKRLQFEVDGEIVHTLTVTAAEPESMVWFPTTYKGELRVKLLDSLTGSEDVYCEAAELLDHKPEVFDLYLYLRLKTARSSSPTIYRGKIVSDAKDLSGEYFEDGMILNGTSAEVPAETKLAKFAPYQAVRDFLIKFFRIVNYDRLKGYSVNGSGNSVLTFDRRGMGDSDADIFQELAPLVAAVTSIKKDVLYKVKAAGGSPSGYITYSGKKYYEDETFRGGETSTFDLANATDLGVFEEDWLIDIDDIPKTGHSNEWVMSIGGQTVYKDTTGATYKPESYGNVKGAFHDRCHTFSSAWSTDQGTVKGKELGKYGGGISAGQPIVQRAETPPGHRYEGDEIPYYSTGGVSNPLISAADGASEFDCRDSIFEKYVSGGTGVDDLLSGDCEGITAHYESCKVFKAPYLIKSIKINSGDSNRVDVELNGRLERSDSAPSSIADTSGSRATYLSTDTGPRTDENTVVGLLSWKIDGTDDEDRIGDISPNAQSPDYDTTTVKGAVLSRFFFQRLVPHVYHDFDLDIQSDRDTKPLAENWQYIEMLIRSSVGGFLDEQRVEDTLTYHAATPSYHSFCDSQDSRDLTMGRVLSLIGSSDDRIAIRNAGESRGGYGVLPNTRMMADAYSEVANILNLLTASRFGVPVFLESRTLTYYDYVEANIETIEGFSIIRGLAFQKPTTLRNAGAWGQDFLPFEENALAYMSILNDGSSDKAFFYWREVEWRVRPHPKVLAAVPDALKNYVDLSNGIGTPIVYQPPVNVRSQLDRDPLPGDTSVEDFTTLVTVDNPAEGCIIGQSGTLAPATPPTGDIAVSTISGSPSSSEGDAESYSTTSMGIETTGEAYIRVPLA